MIKKPITIRLSSGLEARPVAYLQVVEGNTPAITLYESLGFSYLYTYWFRAKNVV